MCRYTYFYFLFCFEVYMYIIHYILTIRKYYERLSNILVILFSLWFFHAFKIVILCLSFRISNGLTNNIFRAIKNLRNVHYYKNVCTI